MSEHSVEDIVRKATVRLRSAGVDAANHDAMALLAYASSLPTVNADAVSNEHANGVEVNDIRTASIMGLSYSRAMMHWCDCSATAAHSRCEQALALFSTLIMRRIHREPLQYIVGHAKFRYLDLAVGQGVFIPRPETELVVQAGLDALNQQAVHHAMIADLCAGSGAIALSVASECNDCTVWAVEQSPQALVWTRRNLEHNLARITAAGSSVELVEADATDSSTLITLNGMMDAVICNPPYIPQRDIPQQPEVRDWEPQQALYGNSPDGLDMPQRIIQRAAALLKVGATLVMEHDVTQGEALCKFALANGFNTATTRQDLTHRDRFLLATR